MTVLLGLSIPSSGQSNIDSLRRMLDTARHWPTVLDLHYRIGVAFRKDNPDSTLAHADFLLDQAQKSDDRNALLQGYDLRAKAFQNKGQFETALRYTRQAYEVAKQLGLQKKMANELQDMSYPLYNLNRFGEAAEKLFAALELYKALRDTNRMAAVNNEIGRVLTRQERYEEAANYIRKGLRLNLTIGANPYYSYSRLGEVLFASGQLDSALLYTQKALEQAKRNGNAKGVALEKFNIGEIHIEKGHYELARAFFEEGLAFFEPKKEAYFTPLFYARLAKVENSLGRPAEALRYATKGLGRVQNTPNYEVFSNLHEQRYRAYTALGDYRGALAEVIAWKTAADSVAAHQRFAQLADVEARYQTREREATIARQELTIARQRNRQQLFLLSGFAVLLAAGGVFFFLRNRERLKKQRAEHALRLQQAEAEKLRELDKLKSDFFANVSHELRTPLTLLLGPIDSVLKNGRLDAHDQSLLQLAQRNAGQLLRLIGDILDLSKLESGKLTLDERSVALYPWLNRVAAHYDSHARRLGIRLVFEYEAPRNLHVLIDPKKLETLLNNLLSNALKFTPPNSDGQVTLRLEDRRETILLSVCDTGRGIPPGDLDRVFDRFYQSRPGNTPAEGGTGIGLAICAEYARLFGGRVWVESPAPGARAETGLPGAVFYLEIPKKEVFGETGSVEPDTPEQHAEAPAFALPAPETPAATILIVEDNAGLQQYLQTIFARDFHTRVAGNGLEALQLLESGPAPDLVLSDLMMPLMDGLQLLEKLKSDERFSAIPVVMLTARADMPDKLHALRTGVDDYLLKPFVEEELLARVQNLLRNARQRIATEPEPGEPATPALSAEHQAWLETLEQNLAARLGDFNLTAETLADSLAMSRAQFFRQVKKRTGLTPAQYLDEARFRQARLLLETGRARSVKAAAYEVGFRDEKHFAREFRQRYGKYPSEYLL